MGLNFLAFKIICIVFLIITNYVHIITNYVHCRKYNKVY